MPADPHKRELRKQKRSIKRAGTKHRRRELKRQLAADPERANEAEETFGQFSSQNFNGLDQDATRQRGDEA